MSRTKEPAAFAEHSPRADRRVDSCCHGDGFGAGKSGRNRRHRHAHPSAGRRLVEPDLLGRRRGDRASAGARVEKILRLLPMTAPSDGQNVNNGTQGAATINLRGLGSQRTSSS